MSPGVEAAAHTQAVVEPSEGISAGLWSRTGGASTGIELGTVVTNLEPGHEFLRMRQVRTASDEFVLSRLESLLRLASDWDSYGGRPVSPLAALSAIQFLLHLGAQPRPSVVPTSHGTVQLEWHGADIDLEIECFPTGRGRLSADDAGSGRSEERWVVPGHPAVHEWLKLLGARSSSS
jgi:hypothetical protein